MDGVETGALAVPGATLHYETRGRGPLLLLIAGANSDAVIFERLAAVLAADHRVVSFDPRGNSRSPLRGPLVDQRVEEHSDDVRRLLDHLDPSGAAVRVFGSCSGGLVALHFAARYPERIAALVVHEPPAFRLLPDAEEHLAFLDTVRAAFQNEGAAAALERLGAVFGGRPAPVLPEARDNTAFFLAHVIHPFVRFTPDLAALAPVADRVVVAGGRDSRAQIVRRPAVVLAEHLSRDLVEFPGGHVGYAKWPEEFGGLLREVLSSAASPFS
ncbi:alpha/beta fold hydrolase [Marinactinospora thermotolerans]|uniref:Pimeloyl-ACP methyl ester carboxylesterase n=1 Tax=Marinactinospora thermotolerans DSM 45154 TaxID=1122192 RepID=A0A1T4PCQ5_9ACTN|nr:alpha/beta hydrolase [Marinactinospora thermotolerans]SJZ89314.1 Pimeloyl-ACP methyl ester carboxylesterase [Marinactinospora thermotolerans DSM 45154]